MSVDFGSEFIKVAIVKPGVPMEIALNKESRRKTPAVVSLHDGERLFSDPAMSTAVRYPKSAYRFLLHVLGKPFDSPAVKLYQERFTNSKLEVDDARGTVRFRLNDETLYSVEELCAMMLNHTREIAEAFAEQPIKDAVITVPPFFSQAERRAVLQSAKLVGLNVLQVMNDNTAVALNYGVFRRSSFNGTEQNIMFFDMGSTKTVATIVAYQTTKVKDFGITETIPQLTVRAVGFDRTLGGLEMDLRLRDHLARVFDGQKKAPESVRNSPRAMAKLLKEANRVKQVLSANVDHFAQIEGLLPDIDFRCKVTRQELEEMCADLFDRVKAPVEQALRSAEVNPSELTQVIIVGGGSRVPKVQEYLMEVTKKTELGKSVNSDEAAALGASYAAAGLSKAFRIKKFGVKDANLFPIDVAFERVTEDGGMKHVRRTVYSRNNLFPQKKVMTFNKMTGDFDIAVDYGDLSRLTPEQLQHHGALNLTRISITGVTKAFEKNKADDIESKGIKAHFHMDAGGVLTLDKVEALFEKAPSHQDEKQQSGDESTFAKLGSKISSFFSGKTSEGAATDSKAEGEKTSDSEDSKDKAKDKSENTEKEVKEEKKEGSDDVKKAEEKTAEQEAQNTTNSSAASSNTTTNTTSKAKKPPQPTIIRENLEFVITHLDIVPPSDSVVSASQQRLADLANKDIERQLLAAVKNSLESHIFETQDRMYAEDVVAASVEEERSKIQQALSEASDWLYEDGEMAGYEAFEKKLKSLQDLSRTLFKRVEEHSRRPQYIARLRDILNTSKFFLTKASNMTPADEEPIYTAVELTTLEKLTNKTEKWLNDTEAKQQATSLHLDPVLTLADLAEKGAELDREVMYLVNKARYWVPKKKPDATAANKTASAGNATNTTTGESTADASGKNKTASTDDTTDDAPTSAPKGAAGDSSEKKQDKHSEL